MPKSKIIILDIRVLISELSKLKVSKFRHIIEASENPEFWFLLLLQLIKSLLASQCKMLLSVKCSLSFSPHPKYWRSILQSDNNLRGKVRENKHFYSNQLMQPLPSAMVLGAIVRLESFKSLKTPWLIAIMEFIKLLGFLFVCQERDSCFLPSSFQICPSYFQCSDFAPADVTFLTNCKNQWPDHS